MGRVSSEGVLNWEGNVSGGLGVDFAYLFLLVFSVCFTLLLIFSQSVSLHAQFVLKISPFLNQYNPLLELSAQSGYYCGLTCY